MYEDLIKSNQNLVRFIANKFRPSRDNLADYLQTGYIGLIKSAKSFRGGSKFSVYAYKSIYWEISNYHKKQKRYKTVMLDKEPELRFTQEFFDSLTDEEQELLHYQLLGYSVKDIADMMKKSKSTIYRMYNKMTKKLLNNESK